MVHFRINLDGKLIFLFEPINLTDVLLACDFMLISGSNHRLILCRPQDIDFPVIPEYLVNAPIGKKMSKLSLDKYKDELLFFLFYTNVGDAMQLEAAAEL